LFAIPTAISWSYYGDRCAYYLFGPKAVLPYRVVFVLMHFVGAVASLDAIWALGDTFLAIVVFPNLIALLLLSGQVAEMTRSYFERRPREENARVHEAMKKAKAEQKTGPAAFVARALCVLISCSPQRRRGGGASRQLNRKAAVRASR